MSQTVGVIIVVVILYVTARVVAYACLQALLKRIRAIAYKMDSIYKTVWEANAEYNKLSKAGGRYYRIAVMVTAFLMYWPVGPALYKTRMIKAYDEVGPFKGYAGSRKAAEDVRRGFAKAVKFYPANHLKGLAASLDVALRYFKF